MILRLAAALGAFTLGLGSSAALAQALDLSAVPPEARFLIFGEIHGTSEIPRFFGEAVRRLSADRPVIVSLELSQPLDSRLQDYLSSDGAAPARDALLSTAPWTAPFPDGRTSEAMLRLIEDLRRLKAQNPSLRVVSCAPAPTGVPFDAAGYELSMARCWIDAQAAEPRATLLALVGNAHSSRTGARYAPAAASLPAATTLALTVRFVGGESWNCSQTGCGRMPMRSGPPSDAPLGIDLRPVSLGPVTYDGSFSTGSSFTASPPAVGEAPG